MSNIFACLAVGGLSGSLAKTMNVVINSKSSFLQLSNHSESLKKDSERRLGSFRVIGG